MIGGGLSNISFLYSLPLNCPYSINIFEKDDCFMGRAATYKSKDLIIDYGANYISTTEPVINDLLINKLPNEDLIKIDKWIWSFDEFNYINSNTEIHNQTIKYSYTQGISNLVKNLFEKSIFKQEKVLFNTEITQLRKNNNSWELITNGKSLGIYDYLITGIPIPQLIKILKNSEELELANKLNYIEYYSIYSLSLAFESDLIFPFYALINSDRKHSISWLSIENCKNDRIKTPNTICFVIQMSHSFTIETIKQNENEKQIINKILFELFKLIPVLEPLKISFSFLKLWENALPKTKIMDETLLFFEEKRIFINGDCLIGKGRLDGVILNGLNLYKKFDI